MNRIMEWVTANWFLVIALMATGISIGTAIYKIGVLPTERQLKKVREWLLYAVTMAEKELGAGTGKLKLRYVYSWFVTTFPWLAKVISFETFSDMVEETLEEMKSLLKTNMNVETYVAERN